MAKFTLINNEYIMVDQNTIDKYNFTNIIEIDDNELNKVGGDYYTKNGELILGTNPIKLYNEEYIKLTQWYNNYYTQHEQKYRRLHSLGKLTDEGKDPYNELINLYKEAEIKRARIQELERLLSDTSK